MACAQKNHLLLVENRTFGGRKGINLLVHACRSILSIFLSFLSNSSFLVFSFSFSVFAYFVVIPSPRLLLLIIPLLCTASVLYIMPTMIGFYHFSLQLLLFGLGVLIDHYWFVYASCVTPRYQTKKTILFVCLPWHPYLLQCGYSLSLSIPHGMHLVVLTHPYFFWEICHPSKTFPPKEPEQESQNRFSPFPTAKPCLLTSDP